MKNLSRKLSVLLPVLLFFVIAQAQEIKPKQPTGTKKELETLLQTAKCIKKKRLGTGVTNPEKLTLDDGKQQFYAVFKTIDESKRGITQLAGSVEYDFKDSWRFEIAAYEVDKLIGLDMVPVTVERTFDHEKGSLQLWIDGCMTERDRLEKHLNPPQPDEWKRQAAKMYLFDHLIYNIDRNLGNLLINSEWRLFLIDHSRSFKSLDMVKGLDDLNYFSRSMIEGFGKLNAANLEEHCRPWLGSMEIKTLLKRRDLILERYKSVLAERGEVATFP